MIDNVRHHKLADWLRLFLADQKLPDCYAALAQKWFTPLVDHLVAHQKETPNYMLVGINGCQGSGKTSLANYVTCVLNEEHGIPAVQLSLDDFYLPRVQREALAETVHTLLRTRGVPGTHQVPLLLDTLAALRDPRNFPLSLPSFDKANDDRLPKTQWRTAAVPPRVVILEGWCLGAPPQPEDQLLGAVNPLEVREDPDLAWRRYVNDALTAYLPLYELVDLWVMFKAPSFDCVFNWRQEQEAKLTQSRPEGGELMDDARLRRFIQHYQRLTEVCLRELPDRVDYLLELDEQRDIISSRWRQPKEPA